MRWIAPFTIVLISAVCGGCPSVNDRDGSSYELSWLDERVFELASSENMAFPFLLEQGIVQSLGTDDPREPEEVGTGAFGSCGSGLAVQPPQAYCLGADLSALALPSSSTPDWSVPFSPLPFGVESLSDQRIAAVRGEEIRVFSVATADTPVLLRVEQAPADALFASLEADGNHLVVAALTSAGGIDVFTFDTLALTTSMQIGRFHLDEIPSSLTFEIYDPRIAMHGHDLIVTVAEMESVIWYRFSSAYDSIEFVDSVENLPILDNGFVSGRHRDAVARGHAMINLPGEDEGIAVLRLDPSDSLVEVRRIKARAIGQSFLEVDDARGLLYAGGEDFRILDLGSVTTGEPDW